jgi:hypothetical protein
MNTSQESTHNGGFAYKRNGGNIGGVRPEYIMRTREAQVNLSRLKPRGNVILEISFVMNNSLKESFGLTSIRAENKMPAVTSATVS